MKAKTSQMIRNFKNFRSYWWSTILSMIRYRSWFQHQEDKCPSRTITLNCCCAMTTTKLRTSLSRWKNFFKKKTSLSTLCQKMMWKQFSSKEVQVVERALWWPSWPMTGRNKKEQTPLNIFSCFVSTWKYFLNNILMLLKMSQIVS